MTNEYQGWKGAVEPAEVSPSGNEYQAWKGAVEPEAVGGLPSSMVDNLVSPIKDKVLLDSMTNPWWEDFP